MNYADRIILTVFCLLMGAFYLIWLGQRDSKMLEYYDYQRSLSKVTLTQ